MVVVAGLGAIGDPIPPCVDCAPLPVISGAGAMIGAVAAALVPVLFSYGGWQQTNFIAEEIIEPEKNLPRALVLGVMAVALVYVLANVAYLGALGVEGLAASTAPAADTMSVLLGPVGRVVISAGIACSTFGFLNLVILVTPRVFQAMAADGLFFERFARLASAVPDPGARHRVHGGVVGGAGLLGAVRRAARLRHLRRLDLLRAHGRHAARVPAARWRGGDPVPGAGISGGGVALRGGGGIRGGGRRSCPIR